MKRLSVLILALILLGSIQHSAVSKIHGGLTGPSLFTHKHFKMVEEDTTIIAELQSEEMQFIPDFSLMDFAAVVLLILAMFLYSISFIKLVRRYILHGPVFYKSNYLILTPSFFIK
ncbi:hypothetical protein [Bacillus cihuensis]|uniref:hypothetical protein n=1 Tax=Bacillus cihuensis TaxID=1208599 RepID=UPI00048F8A5F|nr:hypothetical protein [Bacillus cihuensis]